jgi:hypothetical protein
MISVPNPKRSLVAPGERSTRRAWRRIGAPGQLLYEVPERTPRRRMPRRPEGRRGIEPRCDSEPNQFRTPASPSADTLKGIHIPVAAWPTT